MFGPRFVFLRQKLIAEMLTFWFHLLNLLVEEGQSRVLTNGSDSTNIFRQARIAGGNVAVNGQIPSRVKFYLLGGEQPKIGGGSIISPNWVLSAAHNFPKKDEYEYYEMFVGSVDCKGPTVQQRSLEPDDIYTHPDYVEKEGTLINDIALVLLKDPLVLSPNDKNTKTICLPYPQIGVDLTGQTVLAAGWGATVQRGQPMEDLLWVNLRVISNKECAELVKDTLHKKLLDNQMCTFDKNKDTCAGDSGTTIDLKDPKQGDKYFAVGIVSYGEYCAHEKFPAVYTRVTKFLKWIEDTTLKAGYPIKNSC